MTSFFDYKDLLDIKYVYPSEKEETISKNDENCFFLMFSSQYFFISSFCSDFIVPPFTFFITNENSVSIQNLNESVVFVKVPKYMYGDGFSHVMDLIEEGKQLNFHHLKVLKDAMQDKKFNEDFIYFFLLASVSLIPLMLINNKKNKIALVDKIKLTIEKNATDADLYLEKVASICFCSKRTVQKILKKEGTTFSEIVNKIRVELLCDELINSKDSVEVVSYKCGFNSVAYAIKLFRLNMGVTPNEYRKRFAL